MADYIRPTPRNPILGLLADAMMGGLAYMEDPRRTQQMRGLGGLLSDTGIAQTMERLSYGEPLTTGRGMTTRLRPEAEAALMTLGPEAVPIGRAATAATKAVGRGAMAVGRAGERYAERVVPQIMERGGLPAEMVSAMGQGTQSPLTVYHGSPYRFNRFDPTKIGSGEGAQAFGYGHYVAEAPGVAKSYQPRSPEYEQKLLDKYNRAQAKRDYPTMEILEDAMLHKTPDEIIQRFTNAEEGYTPAHAKAARDFVNWYGKNPPEVGGLYKIDLADEQIARMLDYDKPLSQQPDIVKRINPQSLGLTYKQLENGNHAFVNSEGKIIGNLQKGGTQESFTKNWTEDVLRGTGSDLYRQLGQGMEGGPKVSSALREAGIPGIRYLDEGSRGGGQGTSNFVIFPGEEDLLRILSVNGGLLTP